MRQTPWIAVVGIIAVTAGGALLLSSQEPADGSLASQAAPPEPTQGPSPVPDDPVDPLCAPLNLTDVCDLTP